MQLDDVWNCLRATYTEASASIEENELRAIADAVEDLVSNAST